MNTERVPLSEYLRAFRIDRPSEWQMDSFIERAEELQKRIEELEALVFADKPLSVDDTRRIFREWEHADEIPHGLYARFKSAEAANTALKAGDVQAPKEGRETAWLVENGKQGDELRYRTMINGWPEWTANHNEAIRFSRRIDADMFAAEDEDAWRVVEHMWMSAARTDTEGK